MRLIINISDKDYKECKFRKDLLSLGGEPTELTFNMRIEKLIANGEPLQTKLEEIKNNILQDGNYQIGEDFSEYMTDYQNIFNILDKHMKE